MLKVKTQPRGIDQSEEFVLGGPGGARAYERPVRYEQALVAEIVLGLLQRAIPQTEGLERYRVDVTDETDNAVGELVITRAALERVGGPKAGSLSKDRALATSDTLGESRMWVRIEEPPRPYGARRRSALQIPTVSKRRF